MSTSQRVLIVDDDEAIRQFIAVILAQNGYETLEAADGCAALGLAESYPIDLLLTDVEMPGINGLELIRILKDRQLIERSLVITGCGRDGLEGLNGFRGGVSILGKPFTPQQLLAKVHAVLDS